MTRFVASPQRLAESDVELAKVLRAAPPAPTASDEVRAWDALEQRLRRPKRGYSVAWAAVAAAVLSVCFGVWWKLPSLQRATDPPTVTAESLPSVIPSALPSGRSQLPDGSTVSLGTEGEAIVTVTTAKETRVRLRRGSVDVDAVPQGPEQRLVVEVADHEFRVVGTRFTVTNERSGPSLEVEEGTVEVWRAGRRLASVSAGARWPASQRVVPAPSAREAAAASKTTRDCLQLTRAGRAREAEACLESRAKGSDLDAELALYELARLRQNVRGNSRGAIATLKHYRQRFPTGAFRSEAQLTLVELLNTTGRTAEAATEARQALSAGVAPERAGELHLIVAEHEIGRGDCASAESHLRAAQGIAAGRVATLRERCAATPQRDEAPAPPPVGRAAFDLE